MTREQELENMVRELLSYCSFARSVAMCGDTFRETDETKWGNLLVRVDSLLKAGKGEK